MLFLSANILFSTSLISAAILIIYLFSFVNFGLIFLFSFCHGSLNTVWKRISRHSIAEGSELIKSKEQDKEGTESSEDWPPDRPGRVNSSCGLVANFYSLKANKIHAVRLALGDWWGHCRVSTEVGLLPNLESGSLLLMIRGLLSTVTQRLSQFGDDLGTGLAPVA